MFWCFQLGFRAWSSWLRFHHWNFSSAISFAARCPALFVFWSLLSRCMLSEPFSSFTQQIQPVVPDFQFPLEFSVRSFSLPAHFLFHASPGFVCQIFPLCSWFGAGSSVCAVARWLSLVSTWLFLPFWLRCLCVPHEFLFCRSYQSYSWLTGSKARVFIIFVALSC
jgi:hypothetical protein